MYIDAPLINFQISLHYKVWIFVFYVGEIGANKEGLAPVLLNDKLYSNQALSLIDWKSFMMGEMD